MATQDEKKARIGTIVFHAILVLLFFFMGMKYQDPPPENGIAINFGYDRVGGGNTSSAPVETQEETPQEVQETVTEPTVDNTATQEMVDAPTVNTEETPTQEVVEPTPDPQPSDRLSGALQSTRDGTGSGEGEDEGGGDQGDPNGDPNSPNRTGQGGTGSGGNYRLGNRNALNRPEPDKGFTEEGRVVVKVYVDRAGKVVRAIPGVDIPGDVATNVFSSDLFERAKQAALKTTWQGDPNAIDQQIGFIVYNFRKR